MTKNSNLKVIKNCQKWETLKVEKWRDNIRDIFGEINENKILSSHACLIVRNQRSMKHIISCHIG